MRSYKPAGFLFGFLGFFLFFSFRCYMFLSTVLLLLVDSKKSFISNRVFVKFKPVLACKVEP